MINSLTKYAHDKQDLWDEYLTSILFAYRTSTTSPTGETPFMLVYGRQCTLAPDIALLPPARLPKSKREYRNLLADNLATAHKLAAERNKKKQVAMKERYDTKSKEPIYKVGDKVLLHDSTKKTGVSKKL